MLLQHPLLPLVINPSSRKVVVPKEYEQFAQLARHLTRESI